MRRSTAGVVLGIVCFSGTSAWAQCPPKIAQQPVSQVVCHNEQGSLSVEVGGKPDDLTYQWQVQYPPDSGEWIDLQDGILDLPGLAYPLHIHGARMRIMSSQPTIVENEKGLVISRCIVTRPCGSVASEPAALVFVPPPVITVEPEDVSACNGGDAQLSVTASDDGSGGGGGGSGGIISLRYQWQFLDGGAWIDIAEGADIVFGAGTPDAVYFAHTEGSTTGTLALRTISHNEIHHNVIKRCIVSNACGSVSSRIVIVPVNDPPTIITPPTSIGACADVDAVMTCVFNADGSQGATFCQWQIADPEAPDGWRNLVNGTNEAPGGFFQASGADSPTLVMRPPTVLLTWGCTLRIVVTRACGSVTSDPATVDVRPPLHLWESISSPRHPSHRVFPSLMSDGRGHVVLFGGASEPGPGGIVLTDTWEFDGLIWSPRSNVDLFPQAGRAASMSYDASRQVNILFGGDFANGTQSDETWSWNGDSWSQEHPAVSPPARSFAAMTQIGNQILMFGGRNRDHGYLNDIWQFAGSSWTPLPASGPSPRASHAMVALGNKIIMFGGRDEQQVHADTWMWDGAAWTLQAPLHSPPARFDHAMVYDPALGVVLMIGGIDREQHYLNDLWSWDGTDWTQHEVPGMSARGPRQSVSMDGTFDHGPRPRNRVLVFGGRDQTGGLDDTLILTRALTSPTDVTACPDSQATFSVAPLDPEVGPVQYQWYVKRFGIGGNTAPEAPLAVGPYLSESGEVLFVAENVTSDTLITSNIHLVDDRDLIGLRCVVTNGCGSVPSDAAMLTGSAAPVITGQPHDTQVCSSGAGILMLELAQPESAEYRWQVADSGAPGGWVDMADGTNTLSNGLIFGAEGARVRRVRASKFIRNYGFRVDIASRCIASTACGTVVSEPASISLCDADFNCDHAVSSQDFFDFVRAFFAFEEAADVNADGTINSQDFFDFIGAFFGGC